MQQRWVHAWQRRASFSGCAFVLGLVACAGEGGPESDLARVHGDLSAAGDVARGEAAAEAADVVSVATLSAGASCDALLAGLQNNLLEQVQQRAEEARVSPYYDYYGGGVFIDDAPPLLGTPGPVASGPVASASSASAPPARATPSAFAGFSETTVQVPGVDEGDFVKADGDRLYLIHGGSLYVLDASQANALQIVSSIAIEGAPSQLFVRDGQVVVTSSYDGPLPGQEEDYYYYYYYYPSYTKLTLLDASGDAISVQRETFVEGYNGGSRRHDSVVRTLVQQSSKAQLDYPNVSYFDIFGNPRSQAEIDLQVDLWVLLSTESIEDSEIGDYLPSTFERVDGELVEQPLRCADYLQPGPGLIEAGATSIVALDLAAPSAPLGTTAVLGYADSIYANEDVLLLRQTDYGDYTQPIQQIRTNIHRFELDGLATTYSASGSVTGYVVSPFGLDEADGVVRAVSTEDRYEIQPVEGGGETIVYLGSSSRVVTLGSAEGALVELGRSPDFATDGSLYSSRFVGDFNYAFTYSYGADGASLTTHLQVVDVSDPAAPALAGQTETNALTSQALPFGSDQLLAFGDVIDAIGQFVGAGIQLLDVSDPQAPRVASTLALPQGYSEASYDPRAVTFHPERSLLSFPFQSYETGQTTLEVVHVSPAVGLDHVASIAPVVREPSLLDCLGFFGYPTDPEFLQSLEENPEFVESILSECRLYFSSTARRGLFRGDELFLIQSLGVDAYSVYDLSGGPIGGVELPLGYPYYYGNPLFGVPVPVAPPPSSGEVPDSGGEVTPEEGPGEASGG